MAVQEAEHQENVARLMAQIGPSAVLRALAAELVDAGQYLARQSDDLAEGADDSGERECYELDAVVARRVAQTAQEILSMMEFHRDAWRAETAGRWRKLRHDHYVQPIHRRADKGRQGRSRQPCRYSEIRGWRRRSEGGIQARRQHC